MEYCPYTHSSPPLCLPFLGNYYIEIEFECVAEGGMAGYGACGNTRPVKLDLSSIADRLEEVGRLEPGECIVLSKYDGGWDDRAVVKLCRGGRRAGWSR